MYTSDEIDNNEYFSLQELIDLAKSKGIPPEEYKNVSLWATTKSDWGYDYSTIRVTHSRPETTEEQAARLEKEDAEKERMIKYNRKKIEAVMKELEELRKLEE